MPARGYTVTARRNRVPPRHAPPGEHASENAAKRSNAGRLRQQVAAERAKVRAGRGPRSETGDVTRGTRAPTIRERRRALGAQFPSGRQSRTDQLLHGPSEATQRRNDVLEAFDRGGKRVGFTAHGTPRPLTGTREQRAMQAAGVESSFRGTQQRQNAAAVAPALAVLNETLRPVRAIAGATDATLHGKSQIKAATKGLIKNEGPLFGKVLRDAGLPKSVAGPAGFVLDVGLDPTTYVTFGTSSVAKQAALKAGTETAKRAVKAGMSVERAHELGKVAAKRAAKGASESRGVVVRMAGRDVPGTVRPTAAAGRVVARATPTRVKRAANAVGRQVNPRAAPEGIDRAQYAASRQAERESRAARSQLLRRSQEKARLLREKLDPEDYQQVIGALERGRLTGLPDHLHTPARELRDELRYQARVRRQAGVSQGTIGKRSERVEGGAQGYFPHVNAEALEAPRGAPLSSTRSLKPGSAKGRADKRRIDVINAERSIPNIAAAEGKLSTNVPLVAANYGAETAGAVATSHVVRELARLGKPASRDVALKDGESVYRIIGGRKPVRLDPKNDAAELKRVGRGSVQSRVPEAQAAAKKAAAKVKNAGGDTAAQQAAAKKAYRKKLRAPAGGQYVVLPDRIVNDALGRLTDTRSEVGRVFDLAQGKWKRIATGTPGFHVRNMVGDTQMAYLAQAGHRLPANTAASARALKRQTGRETAQRTGFKPVTRTDKSIKIGEGRVNLDDFLDDAVKQGVIRSGQVGRELEEFRHGTGAGVKLREKDISGGRLKKAGRALNRGFQNREDLMRLSTYKYGLEQGLPKREATDLAMAFHIDYGDITEFEKVFARRAAPFWTFTARALPIHVKALVQKPGKFAAIEKARQETAQAFGLSEDWQGELPEYKQRAIPFGIKVGGRPIALDAALPISLLNELPTTLSMGDYGAELRKFLLGLTSPAVKIPYETEANRSLFFRRDIQSPDYPLVSAPSWVTKLPAAMRKRLGVVDDLVDRRSGKKVPGWPGRVDYYFKSVPGLPYLANQLVTEGSLRSGRQGWEKIPSALGVKTDPVDATTTRIFELLDKSRELNTKISALGQRGMKGGRKAQSPEVRALHAASDAIDMEIYKLSVKRKDAMPLRESSVPKSKRIGTGKPGVIDWSKAKPVTGGAAEIDWSKAKIVIGG